MHRKKLLSLYGLKWNPFTPEVPDDGLLTTPRIESFATRLETMAHEGGFALITGEPGYGKSITLRIIEERLSELPEISVGVLARPQSGVVDFYRELGDLFAVELRPHNRWAGFKILRERWRAHAQASLLKPVFLIDEAQDMPTAVLSELRILSSGKFDRETYLTVVLAGDTRLSDRFPALVGPCYLTCTQERNLTVLIQMIITYDMRADHHDLENPWTYSRRI